MGHHVSNKDLRRAGLQGVGVESNRHFWDYSFQTRFLRPHIMCAEDEDGITALKAWFFRPRITRAEDEDVKAFKLYGTIPQSPRRTLAEKAARAAEEASRKKRSMREAIVRLRAEKGLQIRVEQLRKRKAEKVISFAPPPSRG